MWYIRSNKTLWKDVTWFNKLNAPKHSLKAYAQLFERAGPSLRQLSYVKTSRNGSIEQVARLLAKYECRNIREFGVIARVEYDFDAFPRLCRDLRLGARMRNLALSQVKLSDHAVLVLLASCPNLVRLSVSLNGSGPAATHAKLPSQLPLQHLSVYNSLAPLPLLLPFFLQHGCLTCLSSLRSVSLTIPNAWCELVITAMAQISELAALKLRVSPATMSSDLSLSPLVAATKLVSLDVYWQSGSLYGLRDVLEAGRLESLSLFGTQHDFGAVTSAIIDYGGSLKHLALSRFVHTPEHEFVNMLNACLLLESLVLSQNPYVSDRLVSHFIKQYHFQRLDRLCLHGMAAVTGASVALLLRKLANDPACSLKTLEVCNCGPLSHDLYTFSDTLATKRSVKIKLAD